MLGFIWIILYYLCPDFGVLDRVMSGCEKSHNAVDLKGGNDIPSDMYVERRLKSVCTSTQCDLHLRCSLEETMDLWLATVPMSESSFFTIPYTCIYCKIS